MINAEYKQEHDLGSLLGDRKTQNVSKKQQKQNVSQDGIYVLGFGKCVTSVKAVTKNSLEFAAL